jgi:hypothetical protein
MKLFKKRILFICLVISFQMDAQSYLQKHSGKSFESKVAYAKKQFESNVNNESLKIEYTRLIEIRNPNELNLKIKRVRQKSKTSMTSMDIDTDKPFPNNDIEKGALENYLEHTNKPIKLIVSQKNKSNLTSNMWLAKLPMINSIQQLSGIFLMNFSKESWTDTLQTDEQTYINKYVIEGDSTILLQGSASPRLSKQVGATTGGDISNPNSGESLQAQSDGKRLQYKAKIYFNKSNNFISKIDGSINTVETMTVMGQKHDRNINEFFQVINKEL